MHWRRRPVPTILPLLALQAACSTAWAEAPKTDGLWRGTGGASFSSVAGNSTSTALGLDTSFRRATPADTWTLDARARYARSEADGVRRTTSNQWAANGQYDRNLGEALYAFGKLGLESDAVVELDLRSTLGTGVGHKWLRGDRHQASVFGGAAYTVDRYARPTTVDGRSARRFSRSSLLLGQESQHGLSDTTTLKQRLEVYTGLSGDRAVLTKFTASMAVAVSARLNLTLGLSHLSNSKPPAGARRDDLGLLAGLSLRFGAD